MYKQDKKYKSVVNMKKKKSYTVLVVTDAKNRPHN